MSTSLTTFDGFPRADIDVAQIRTTRARIVRLKNDHKTLMGKLEKAIEEHFAAGKTAEASAAAETAARAPEANHAIQSPASSSGLAAAPFAKVNSVAPDSPADEAGMQVGDRVTTFGSVNFTNHERLSKVAQVVQQNENVSDPVALLPDKCADL